MKNFYLTLSIIGAILPYIFFTSFMQTNGIDLPLFIESLFINGAAGGFTVDLLISSFVFWIMMFKENKVKLKWLIIVLNLTIGLSCALPFYLYLRED